MEKQFLLGGFANFLLNLEHTDLTGLSTEELDNMEFKVQDFEGFGLQLGWLREVFGEVGRARTAGRIRRLHDQRKAEVDELNAEIVAVVEQRAKLDALETSLK